jgi:hypothetical protein
MQSGREDWLGVQLSCAMQQQARVAAFGSSDGEHCV